MTHDLAYFNQMSSSCLSVKSELFLFFLKHSYDLTNVSSNLCTVPQTQQGLETPTTSVQVMEGTVSSVTSCGHSLNILVTSIGHTYFVSVSLKESILKIRECASIM